MNYIKLTKTQQSLVKMWENDLSKFIQSVSVMASDIMNMRLEKLAREAGANVDTEDWEFKQDTFEFVRKGVAQAAFQEGDTVEDTKQEDAPVTPVVVEQA